MFQWVRRYWGAIFLRGSDVRVHWSSHSTQRRRKLHCNWKAPAGECQLSIVLYCIVKTVLIQFPSYFSPFCGLLTRFLPFHLTRSVNRNLIYLRLTRAVFERTSMVNGEGSSGHYIMVHMTRTNISLQEKQKVFTSENRAEMSNLEALCTINNWYLQSHERTSQTIIPSKGHRTKYERAVSSHWKSFLFVYRFTR